MTPEMPPPRRRCRGRFPVVSRKPRRPKAAGAPPVPESRGRTPQRAAAPSSPAGQAIGRDNGYSRTITDTTAPDTVTATVLAFPEPPVRRRRRWVIISVVSVTVVVAAFLAFLFLSPALALKTVTVQGISLLSKEQVNSSLQPLMGRPLTTIGDDDVAALLADRPEVAGVHVVAKPPHEIEVTIAERVPVAVLQSGTEFLLIDQEGMVIGSAANRTDARLPLIDGGTEAVNSAVFSTVTSVLSVLPEKVLAELDHASASSVDSVELKLINGQTVFWGSAEANVAKARAVEAMLQMPEKDPPVRVFDVSTPTAPVTR